VSKKDANSKANWDNVCAPAEAISLDLAKCCYPIESEGSAIDAFYATNADTLRLGTPERIAESPTLGRLLVLGLVTGVEAYFRTLFLNILTICPLSREAIADQAIPFGAVEFYGPEQAVLGLFEGSSFAGETEIKKRTRQVLGVVIPERESLGVALREYEKVCHIRHASVHAQGVLNRGNAKALGVSRQDVSMHVIIDFSHLHMAARACINIVRAYNLFAYRAITQRWLDQRLLVGNWESDKRYFKPLVELFYSREDGSAVKRPYSIYLAFRPSILSRLDQ
jgi:hypothetical protein